MPRVGHFAPVQDPDTFNLLLALLAFRHTPVAIRVDKSAEHTILSGKPMRASKIETAAAKLQKEDLICLSV